MTSTNKWLLLAGMLSLASGTLFAQTTRSTSSRGYATDTFEGFDSFAEDKRIPQKTKSFWYSVTETTPEKQLEFARNQEAQKNFRKARKAYEALIREWPTSPIACEGQFCLANMQEKNANYDTAFDEYQYLLIHYAGNCPFDDILQRQFRIANSLLHNNQSMFGWILNGMDSIRERFEQIVRNAPRSTLACESLLIIGGIRMSEKELDEAIAVYDGLLNRFPQAPQTTSAVFLAAQCRHTLAVNNPNNEARCRESIGFFKAVIARYPDHPQKTQLVAWLEELKKLLVEQNYQQAFFYDSRQRNVDAAKAAYRRFLTEFADSKYGPTVRDRLVELEKTATPTQK